MSRRNLSDNSGAHYAEVGEITRYPQEDDLQALQHQHHLEMHRRERLISVQ